MSHGSARRARSGEEARDEKAAPANSVIAGHPSVEARAVERPGLEVLTTSDAASTEETRLTAANRPVLKADYARAPLEWHHQGWVAST